jgi:hypothetical protein
MKQENIYVILPVSRVRIARVAGSERIQQTAKDSCNAYAAIQLLNV